MERQGGEVSSSLLHKANRCSNAEGTNVEETESRREESNQLNRRRALEVIKCLIVDWRTWSTLRRSDQNARPNVMRRFTVTVSKAQNIALVSSSAWRKCMCANRHHTDETAARRRVSLNCHVHGRMHRIRDVGCDDGVGDDGD